MDSNRTVDDDGAHPAPPFSSNDEAIAATIADLRTLRDEEIPIPDAVADRIAQTVADLTGEH